MLFGIIVRVLTSSSYDTAADSLPVKLGWRKLDTQRKFEKAVLVYKSLNGLAPYYLCPMFIDCNRVTNYSVRDIEGKLAVPKLQNNYLKNTVLSGYITTLKKFKYIYLKNSYSGAVLWNSLPIELCKTKKLGCNRFFI